MKKTFLFFLTIASVLLVSCSNDDSAASTAVSSETSVSIAAYVADNFPATKVITSTTYGSIVTTVLNTGEELTFTTGGTFMAYSNNASQGLAADSIIVTDTTTTDSTDVHHHHGHGEPRHGGHDGNTDGGPGQGGSFPDSIHINGHHGHDRHFKNEISVDSLTAAIDTFIVANYSGYTIIHAETDTICEGIVTEVLVCKSTSEPVKLIFDATGVYLMKTARIHYADVPTAVTDVVTANYSTYTSKKRAELITLADGTLRYKIFLSLDSTHKTVTFNADGSVECEK
jgi:hypothetical protein